MAVAKQKPELNIEDYLRPLNVNGMQGRVLHMPAPKGRDREVLFVYGHHSSIERWFGLMQNINRYAAVTMPDLPGFGGMDSFYKIGEEATLDNLADYLASFVKMRYKRKKVTIAGMSLGFVVATRMLQRNPETRKRVEMVISIAGFAHQDDFVFSKNRHNFYSVGSALFSRWLPAQIFRYGFLNRPVIRSIYQHTHNAKKKFAGLSNEELSKMLDAEVKLWQENDVRTYMKTSHEFLNLDNCTTQVDLPVYHIAVKADNYFDNERVEQHMRVIYDKFTLLDTLDAGAHAPSVIATAKEAAPYVPAKLRRLLTKKA